MPFQGCTLPLWKGRLHDAIVMEKFFMNCHFFLQKFTLFVLLFVHSLLEYAQLLLIYFCLINPCHHFLGIFCVSESFCFQTIQVCLLHCNGDHCFIRLSLLISYSLIFFPLHFLDVMEVLCCVCHRPIIGPVSFFCNVRIFEIILFPYLTLSSLDAQLVISSIRFTLAHQHVSHLPPFLV